MDVMAADPRDIALALEGYEDSGVSSAITSGLTGMVKSFATWGVLFMGAQGAFNVGKKKLIASAAVSRNVSKTVRAAANAAHQADDSLSVFLSRGKLPGGKAAGALHKAVTNTHYKEYLRRTDGKNIVERWDTFKTAGMGRPDIALGMAGKYAKDSVVAFPFFYGVDRIIGHPTDTAAQRQKRDIAWYNLPGRAWDIATYVPEFIGYDAMSRGMMGGAQIIGTKLLNNKLNPDGMTKSVVATVNKALEWWKSDKNKIRPYVDKAMVHKAALKTTLKERESYRVHMDRTKTSHLKFVGKKEGAKDISALYKEQVRTQAKVIRSRKSAMDDFSVSHFKRWMGPIASRREDDQQQLIKSFATPGMSDDYLNHIETNLFDAKKTSTFTERLVSKYLGFERARLKHYDYSTQQRVQMTTASFFHDIRQQPTVGLEQQAKLSRIFPHLNTAAKDGHKLKELLADRHIYYAKNLPGRFGGKGKIVDIRNYSPGAIADKAISSLGKTTRLGPALDTLYPIRGLLGQDLPMFIPIHNTLPISGMTGANVTDEGLKSGAYLMNADSPRQAFKFSGQAGGKGNLPGVLIRTPGKRSYTLFGPDLAMQNTVELANNIRPFASALSKKGGKIVYQSAGFLPPRDPDRMDKTSPFRQWLHQKFDLGASQGANASIFEMVSSALMPNDPTKPHYMLDKIKSNIAKFDSKAKISPLMGKQLMVELAGAGTMFAGIEKEAYDKVFLGSDSIYSTLLTTGHGSLLLDNIPNVDIRSAIRGNRTKLSTEDFLAEIQDDVVKSRKVVKYLMAQTGDSPVSKASISVSNSAYIKEHLLDSPESFLQGSGRGESPHQKMLRYIADVSTNFELSFSTPDGSTAVDRAIAAVKARTGSRFSDKELSLVQMVKHSKTYKKLLQAEDLGPLMGMKTNTEAQSEYRPTVNKLIEIVQEAQHSDEATAYLKQIHPLKQFNDQHVGRAAQLSEIKKLTSETQFVAVDNSIGGWFKFGSTYTYETFGTVLDWVGLGWDRGKYKDILPQRGDKGHSSWLGLMGRRAALMAGIELTYDFADTVTDTLPVFEGTALDEGITVGVADQAVRLRLLAAKVYDITGVTAGAKYLEGLMPKSTSTLPGAAIGFAIGGAPGALAGAVINRWLQPTMAEGPLGFLSIIPLAAPFVTDMTKSYDELRDIYSGKELVPVRKGAGWTLGSTPIEGGRTMAVLPNWYARMKAQVSSSPVQYGSPWEEFIFKDRSIIDFSIGDLIDPQYLTRKHYFDRPYMEPDVPFSEVPLVGPILGATAGRLYNFLHPMGTNSLMHLEDARSELGAGVTGKGKGAHEGKALAGFSQYKGVLGGFDTDAPRIIPGMGVVADEYIARATSPRAIISESVYRGLIEAPGLTGFLSSQAFWGGDEPFVDETYLTSSSAIDSTARKLWDANLGDLLFLNEGIRRLYPRPRTSFNQANPIPNQMPTWLPEEFRTGDPYCVTDDTEIEVLGGLKRADEIEEGDLVRTTRGRYVPVSAILPRPVKERVYVIKLKHTDTLIRVTSEHPFLVSDNGHYVKAENLTKKHRVRYPLRDLRTTAPAVHTEMSTRRSGVVTGGYAFTLGIILAYGKYEDEHIKLINCPIDHGEIVHLVDTYFGVSVNRDNSFRSGAVAELLEQMQTYGIPDELYAVGTPALLQFTRQFLTTNMRGMELTFEMPTRNLAYQIWSHLAQLHIHGVLEGNTVQVYGKSAVTLHHILTGERVYDRGQITGNELPSTILRVIGNKQYMSLGIEWIKRERYDGLVYGFEVDTDDSFCVGCVCTHNTKRPLGEYILPGSGYEATHETTIDFPSGISRLGSSAFDQAMGFLGLNQFDEDAIEIMEGGTAIHRMVQTALKAENRAIKTEALITDPENRLSSYVDLVFPTVDKVGSPGEIKSISAAGFSKLRAPKRANVVQLNAYMHIMGAQSGKIIYVNRDDPSQVKSFFTRYNADMWDDSINTLNQARGMAAGYLEEGYGQAAGGYSYTDRFEVLLNTSPFSKEFREIGQIVEEQAERGMLTDSQVNRLDMLKRHAKGVVNKYEMYDKRFQGTDWIAPSAEYTSYNLNENIRAAAEYSLTERAVGAVWEKLMSYRTPLHTKFFGVYSPEEMYDNEVVLGKGFQGWGNPVESFIKPWTRGALSATGPVQGALSWGAGGALVGGPFGATVGAAVGAAYGTAHGLARTITGTEYKPDHFEELSEYSEYFDVVKYDKASRMYDLTKDSRYLRQMSQTAVGFGAFAQNPEEMNQTNRYAYQAYNMQGTPNYGHHSPWGGQDTAGDTSYRAQLDLGVTFSAIPYWDRPFFTAFMNERDPERRQQILRKVDASMARVLSKTWNESRDSAFDATQYFETHQRPLATDPIMQPSANMDFFEMKTVESAGLDSHDFGLGWRDQVKAAEQSLLKSRALDIHAPSSGQSSVDIDIPEIQGYITQQLTMSGMTFTVEVTDTPSAGAEGIKLEVEIQRDSAREISRRTRG